MPLEKIVERIKKDAKVRATEIIKKGEAEAKKLREETKEELESLKDKLISSGEKEAKDLKRQMLAMARLEARNSLLQAKQGLLEKVFQQAKQRLLKMPRPEYERLLYRMVVSVASGGEEIILSEEDRKRLGKNWLSRVNSELAKQGKRELKLAAKNRPINRGFILSHEGVEINYSFEELVASIREEIEPRIIQLLFGKNG
jgi:V/A-type H+-transporting ATPase subunit E